MNWKYIITLTLLLGSCASVSAQFSIKKQAETQPEKNDLFKSTLNTSDMTNDYYDLARVRDQKRKQRHERNTVEFTSKLEGKLIQYDNWMAGGDNTFSSQASVYYRHQYKPQNFSSDFIVDARYGINVIDRKPFKNVDQLSVTENLSRTMHKNWSYSALLKYQTQFTDGFVSRSDSTLKSSFMAPGYIDVSVGFTFAKGAWKITISPIGGNIITNLDSRLQDKDRFGVTAGDRALIKVGPSVNIFFDKTFGKKKIFHYRTTLYAFTDIQTAPTARWSNLVELNLTKYLKASLDYQAYYLKSAIDQIQHQYQTTLGLTYTFKNK